MDKSQADVVAQAILEPSLKEQAEVRQLRERRAQRAAAHRRQTLYFVVGYVAGAAIGYFGFGRVAMYGVAGGFLGLLAGALIARLVNRPAA
ncbi:hypothetical protein [Luteimonas sp. 100069]|uniref:hypothetical protein n=1 Tax=Luteimonas sp. 100069 TaxID=2006109 RepID=UPI000F511668|nr:hypothetical protein [Luteimonas sp. 100069]RPD83478.1 hypothetical protein EGK76_15175 [Luteimonas sp. 100069]